jgi:hypothetical protein
LTVFIDPNTDVAWSSFTAQKVITISDNGGVDLPSSNGKDENITFIVHADGDQNNTIISAFNNALAATHNPVRVVNATIRYSADIVGEGNGAIISYKITVLPSITKYIIQKDGPHGTVIDLNWRNLTISQPIIIDTPKYGKININYPIGLLQVTHPPLAQQLLDSPASSIMQSPILDFRQLGGSLDNWHFLFDPTGGTITSYGIY